MHNLTIDSKLMVRFDKKKQVHLLSSKLGGTTLRKHSVKLFMVSSKISKYQILLMSKFGMSQLSVMFFLVTSINTRKLWTFNIMVICNAIQLIQDGRH